MKAVKAFAPATIGNFIVGFDILGMAVDQVGDIVTVVGRERVAKKHQDNQPPAKVSINEVVGETTDLPTQAAQNTAGAAILSFLEDDSLGHSLNYDFEITIEKGIPLSSGMGGSAASAVAAVVAVNEFLSRPLARKDLLKYCVQGEAVASGTAHADNVAPCLLGGLQLLTTPKINAPVSVPFDEDLAIVLVNPSIKVDTKKARGVLQDSLPLAIHSKQMAAFGGFLTACFLSDRNLIKENLADVLIEPQRGTLIPGFQRIKKAAEESGALACSISGAGPSVFAVCDNNGQAEAVKNSICRQMEFNSLRPRAWITKVNKTGARII